MWSIAEKYINYYYTVLHSNVSEEQVVGEYADDLYLNVMVVIGTELFCIKLIIHKYFESINLEKEYDLKILPKNNKNIKMFDIIKYNQLYEFISLYNEEDYNYNENIKEYKEYKEMMKNYANFVEYKLYEKEVNEWAINECNYKSTEKNINIYI